MYINHEEVCRLLEDGKNATRDDVLKILNKAREKVTKALIDKDEINIIDISVNEQPKCSTLCKFRCAVCGQIYEIDYTKEDIKCPLCLSSKIMTNEEAGFLK